MGPNEMGEAASWGNAGRLVENVIASAAVFPEAAFEKAVSKATPSAGVTLEGECQGGVDRKVSDLILHPNGM
jgi:hypothetical protein